MKVLYFLPGTGVGGIGKFVRDIVSKTSYKIDYTFVTLGDPSTKLAAFLKENGKFLNYSGWGIPVLKGVYQELKHNKYNIVHAHLGCWSFIILGIARLSGVSKRFAHAHSADSFSTMEGVGKIVYALSMILNGLTVTNYLACSNHACECTFGKHVIKSRKYNRVVNPVDDRFFLERKPKYVRNELGIPETSKVICHVGYMGYHKNHPFILKLAKQLQNEDIYWILVGDGNKRKEFEKYVQDNCLTNVRFTGLRNDIPNILDESNVFILPSLLEGLGTVVLEAQARGKKCIISENVTTEVDMGLELVKQIPLSDIDRWKDELVRNEYREVHIEKIKEIYIKKCVEIEACASYLISLYS